MGKRGLEKLRRREELVKNNPLIPAEAVCRALRITMSGLKKMIRNGEFPLPLVLSKNIKRWHIDDVSCFLWWCQLKSRMGRPDHDEISQAVQEAKDYRKVKTGFVYFVRGGEFVKIGYASNAKNRVRDLQVNCPFQLSLIYSMPGTFQTEIGLHRRFKAHATSGEWFRWCDEIAEFIESMRSAGEQ